MRILVVGAPGKTGRRVVSECLEKGHDVLAFVRPERRYDVSDPRLSVVRGDAADAGDVEGAVRRAEAVVSVLGLAKGSPSDICSIGVGNIVHSMKTSGVRRLVCQSSYGAGDSRGGGFYCRLLWTAMGGRMEDKERMEKIVVDSGLDWTIVRPTILTDGPKTGRYEVGPHPRVGIWPKVSRGDLAQFIVKETTDGAFVHESPTITS